MAEDDIFEYYCVESRPKDVASVTEGLVLFKASDCRILSVNNNWPLCQMGYYYAHKSTK